ncbi:sensor histidine kinase [Cronobacter malonaticus]
MSNDKELKDKISELFMNSDGQVDYNKLIEVATDLSSEDLSNIRFSVDAKIVERLGEQLVAKKTTALSELIKNAYDADASSVNVDFIGTEEPGGVIIIRDDGHGMDHRDLLRGFMTISTSDKVTNPTSFKYQRAKAGKKGIGRFSAQKLGSKLELITKKEDEKHYICMEVDWDKFVSGVPLSFISNKIDYIDEGYDFEHGTLLKISGVREAWTDNNIKVAFNYVSNIIKIPTKVKKIDDPGFVVNFHYVNKENNINSAILLDNNTEFLDYADLKATGYMNDKAELVIEVEGLTDKRFTDTLIFKEGYNELLKEFDYKFEGLYFSMEKGSPKPRSLQNFLYNNGGIKFYRNGFNVAPFGERYNDWLGLDESSRRRLILPPHSNTNFLGNVYVTDSIGAIFEETSAREGVIENDAFKDLVNTTKNIAMKIASHVATIRNKKITSSQQGYAPNLKTKEDTIQDKISKLKEKLIVKEEYEKESLVEINDNITSDVLDNSGFIKEDLTAQQLIADLNDVTTTFIEYVDERLLYRVLSSLGLAISEFTHEIQLCLLNLQLTSQNLELLSEGNDELQKSVFQFSENLSMMVAYTDFFDGTMRSNSNREKNNYDLRKLIKRFIKGMEPTTKRRGYKFNATFDKWGIWTKKIHISEIMSVFMNLFTNSCKAIERSGKKEGIISINVTTNESFITILFEDNGDGIPKDKWAKVFEPLYTTAMPANSYGSDNEYSRGMGLGLAITEEIISEMQGEISIIEPSPEYKTCIKIILPLADELELPEDAY